MATTASGLHAGIHAEHFDEATYLYGQIDVLRADEERPYTDVAPFESRLVAHLDGLLLGAAGAQRVVDAAFDAGAASSWYVAAILPCMRADAAAFRRLVRTAEEQGAAVAAAALADALRHRLPRAWAGEAASWLSAIHEPWLGEMAKAMALHGLPCHDVLAKTFVRVSAPTVALIDAVGHARCSAASGRLVELALQGASAEHRRAALLALAHLGDRQAVVLAMRRLRDDAVASHPALALMGGRSAAESLVHALLDSAAMPATLRSLGLLGDLRAVRPLLEKLGDPSLAAHAAWALECITGAGLRTTQFEPDDEAPPASNEQRLGAPGGRGGIGDAIRRMGREREVTETDRSKWEAWLHEARPRFNANLRYRFGEPWTSALVAASLEQPRDPSYREAAARELAIRQNAPPGLDLRATVGRQRATLVRLADWARDASSATDAGKWWYAGAAC